MSDEERVQLYRVVGEMKSVVGLGRPAKNCPTPKMWLLGNAWKILREILYGSLADFCRLACWFFLILLYYQLQSVAYSRVHTGFEVVGDKLSPGDILSLVWTSL